MVRSCEVCSGLDALVLRGVFGAAGCCWSFLGVVVWAWLSRLVSCVGRWCRCLSCPFDRTTGATHDPSEIGASYIEGMINSGPESEDAEVASESEPLRSLLRFSLLRRGLCSEVLVLDGDAVCRMVCSSSFGWLDATTQDSPRIGRSSGRGAFVDIGYLVLGVSRMLTGGRSRQETNFGWKFKTPQWTPNPLYMLNFLEM